MKLIILNFDIWSGGASGGRLRRIYKRIMWKGYKWTPFVIVHFKWLPKTCGETLSEISSEIKK